MRSAQSFVSKEDGQPGSTWEKWGKSMVRKKMEGDEQQRRRAAREARESGKSPSEESVTTGASKQRHSRPKSEPHHHEERLSSIHKGKQQDRSPKAPPGSR